ncbi:hypothetical protein [Kingella oralis]|uniref:hypothetical protein n=1 Tax=Kingella oralis TaxID=505 RepID=UPI002D80D8C7|nr:hypothetical protein [Kingella oralis]
MIGGRDVFRLPEPDRQPEKTKPLGVVPNGFLLGRLVFRLPQPAAHKKATFPTKGSLAPLSKSLIWI